MTILVAFCAGFVLGPGTEANDALRNAIPVPLNGSVNAAIDPIRDTE